MPDIALITIPAGLHANKGDKAVVEFLEEQVRFRDCRSVIEASFGSVEVLR